MEMLCEYNGENFDEICLKIYDFMEKNKKFFKNILKNNREDFFSDFLYKYVLDAYYQNYKNFVKITTITDEAKFKMAAMANLSVFWFKKWIEEDCSIPAETMIQWGKDIIIDIYSICKTEQKQ